MNIYCEHCQKDLKSNVRLPQDRYQPGRIICPFCHKENKRYLSEYDLYLYFTVTSAIYTICLQSALALLSVGFTDHLALSIVLSLIIVIIGYLLTDYTARIIYQRAPFKNRWKNLVIKEDAKEVTRRINWQFIIFLAITAVLGAQTEFFLIYTIITLALLAINFIKTYFLFKKEKSTIPDNYIS